MFPLHQLFFIRQLSRHGRCVIRRLRVGGWCDGHCVTDGCVTDVCVTDVCVTDVCVTDGCVTDVCVTDGWVTRACLCLKGWEVMTCERLAS